MRKLLAVSVLAVAGGLLAAPAPGATTVRVGDNWFKPKRLTVDRGTVVTWRFVGERVHNVTVTRGPVKFYSPSRSSGTFRKRIKRRGTYKIICSIHEGTQRMTLVVD